MRSSATLRRQRCAQAVVAVMISESGRPRCVPCSRRTRAQRSCARAGVGVHGGDHPILGHPPRDPQVVRPSSRSWPSTVASNAAACWTGRQACDHPAARARRTHREPGSRSTPPSGPVVPVDLRLAVAGVVVPAAQPRPQRAASSVGDREQPPHRRADQRDGVHRGHRVNSGSSPAPAAARPARPRPPPPAHLETVRSCRSRSRARMSTSTVCATGQPEPYPPTPRVAPAHVEGVPSTASLRKPVQPLQHHHRATTTRTQPARDRRTDREQLVEQLPLPANLDRVSQHCSQTPASSNSHLDQHAPTSLQTSRADAEQATNTRKTQHLG